MTIEITDVSPNLPNLRSARDGKRFLGFPQNGFGYRSFRKCGLLVEGVGKIET
jgi:hypothetical protein